MKLKVELLEKIGQTQSIHQAGSADHMIKLAGIHNNAFSKLRSQHSDLICILLPDEDDDGGGDGDTDGDAEE